MTKRALVWLILAIFFIPTVLLGGATFSRVKTWSTGQTLTASDLNAEFDNILNNLTPAGVDDQSSNAAAMQATADPYPGGSESLATSLTGEIQRLRYMIQQITGMTYWYQDPVDEIFIPASYMVPRTNSGPQAGTVQTASYEIMVDYLAFDTTTSEILTFPVVMPSSWNLGTIKVKFIWKPGTDSGAVADTVEWAIAARAGGDGDTLDAIWGTAQVISDSVLTGESATIHISDATPALTVGGTPALGDIVYFKLYRNVSGSDNHAYDAWLLGAVIQYTKGSTAGAAW